MSSEGAAFLDGRVILHGGDSRELVKVLAPGSIDAVVTDPPYALVSIVKRFGKNGAAPAKGNDAYTRASAGFMGKQWDTGELAFDPAFWADVLAAMKPGAHLVAFSGTRSYHRLACAIEDAGFEIRDSILDMIASDDPVKRFLATLSEEQGEAFLRCVDESTFGGMLAWVYGSGFPKSHDVSKAIDKKLGAAREKKRVAPRPETSGTMAGSSDTRPWIERSREVGYHEVDGDEPPAAWQGWGTALKPAWEPIVLARKPLGGSVAGNVLEHGTGALNIDGCRVGVEGERPLVTSDRRSGNAVYGDGLQGSRAVGVTANGRWPANVVHDGSEEVLAGFPDTVGQVGGVNDPNGSFGYHGGAGGLSRAGVKDSGSAARFFYTAKADAEDRLGSKHPTVKPVDLMQWLVRLICPKSGTVLDPFAGTGTTGEAAWREGCWAVLFERDEEYRVDIARRMELALAPPRVRKAEIAKRKGLRGNGAAVEAAECGLFGDDAPAMNPEQGGATGIREIREGRAELSGRSD